MFDEVVRNVIRWARRFAASNNDPLRHCRLDSAVVESAALEGVLKARETWDPTRSRRASFPTWAQTIAEQYVWKRIKPSQSEAAFRKSHIILELDRGSTHASRDEFELSRSSARPEIVERGHENTTQVGDLIASEGGNFADQVEWRSLLSSLPEDQEQVMVLRYVQNLSLHETAAALGEAWNHMRVWRCERVARALLREWLAG
jgi:RNA polymerase sigma factor (sigma-70 family)